MFCPPDTRLAGWRAYLHSQTSIFTRKTNSLLLKHQYLQGKRNFYFFISIFTRFSNISLLILRNRSARDSRRKLVRLWTTALPGGSRPALEQLRLQDIRLGGQSRPQRQTTRLLFNGRLTKKIPYTNKKPMPICFCGLDLTNIHDQH